MVNLKIILLILGLICLILDGFGVVASPRIRLQSIGLAFWLAAIIAV